MKTPRVLEYVRLFKLAGARERDDPEYARMARTVIDLWFAASPEEQRTMRELVEKHHRNIMERLRAEWRVLPVIPGG